MWPDFQQAGAQACHYLLYSWHFGCVGNEAFQLMWFGGIVAMGLAVMIAWISEARLRWLAVAAILAFPFIAMAGWAWFAYLPVPYGIRLGSIVELMALPLIAWVAGSAATFALGLSLRGHRRAAEHG